MPDDFSSMHMIYGQLWSAASPVAPDPAQGGNVPQQLPAEALPGVRRPHVARLVDAPLGTERPARAAARLERRVLQFPGEVLASLGQQFPEHDLVLAGAMLRDAEGELAPAPALQAPVELIALRAAADGPPFDLLSPAGCLSGAEPAQAMLGDYRIFERFAEFQGYVFVAVAWEDFRWCEAAGLAVVYCPGAENLTVSLMRALAADLAALVAASEASVRAAAAPATGDGPAIAGAKTVTLDGPPEAGGQDVRANEPDPADHDDALECEGRGAAIAPWDAPALAIVAWSPAGSGEELPGLAAQLLELSHVEQALGENFPELISWSPPAEDRERLARIQRHGDERQLRQAVTDSVETSGRMLSALVAPPPPQDYISARAQYRRVLQDPTGALWDATELAVKRAIFDRFLQADLIEPLLARGASAVNPLERTQYCLVAEIFEQFCHSAPLVLAQLCGPPAGPGIVKDRYAGAARQFIALTKTLASLLKSSP